MADISPPVAFCDHDHRACAQDVLRIADQLAKTRGLRLTPVRRRTLEILLESHKALGAYDVLERLAADGYAAQPPVAYRALEFLVENGFAHRIRRLNAFTACMHPQEAHRPMFFICKTCARVAETSAALVFETVKSDAADLGFSVERTNLEAVGQCPVCQEVDG